MNSKMVRSSLVLLAMVCAVALIYLAFPKEAEELTRVLATADLREVSQYLRSFGIWAVVVSLGLNIVQSMVAFMPSVFLSGANAAVFGLFWGMVISWLGEVLGAAITFWFYRFLGRDALETILARNKDKSVALSAITSLQQLQNPRRGFWALVTARLLPFMPSGLVTLLAAMSRISFGVFFLATALGKAPSLILETLIGHDLLFFAEHKWRLILILGGLAGLWLAWHYRAKLKWPYRKEL